MRGRGGRGGRGWEGWEGMGGVEQKNGGAIGSEIRQMKEPL